MVLNVPISPKWSLKFLFLHNWQFFQIFLAKIYVYIASYKAYLERKNGKKQKLKKRKQTKKQLLQPEDKEIKSLKKKGKNCYL